jgi:Fe-S-cluster containining protein
MKQNLKLKIESKNKKNDMTLSCSQCGLCCKLFLINLTKDEWQSGEYETELKKYFSTDEFKSIQKYGGNVLKQHADGSCIYLHSNLCSIHKKRPQSCRNFYCTSTSKKYKDMIRLIKVKRGGIL